MAHDVGHTPFAHTGEEVLNELMPGGFRHNVNSVRVLERIEQHKGQQGLNISKEVLNGVACHSGYGTSQKGAATLEGQIIRFSDKIAYVQHDIDDSIRAGVLQESDFAAAIYRRARTQPWRPYHDAGDRFGTACAGIDGERGVQRTGAAVFYTGGG